MQKLITCPRCGQENIPVSKDGIFVCYGCKKAFRLVSRDQLFSEKNLKLHGKMHRN
jgi:ribosomal protein L37AE/L43A